MRVQFCHIYLGDQYYIKGGRENGKNIYIYVSMCVCVCTMEEGTRIAREDGRRRGIIIITIYN